MSQGHAVNTGGVTAFFDNLTVGGSFVNTIIFSVSMGHGHNQVARALSTQLAEQGHTAQIIDALEFVSPFFSKVLLESYLTMLRYTPHIYGRLYQMTEEPPKFDFALFVNKLLSRGFKKLVARLKPDVIVCTHPFPTGLMSAFKTKLGLDLPLVAVMTDYTVHNLWIHPTVDCYITPCSRLDYLFKIIGVPDEKVMPLGIPIRPVFAKPPTKARARRTLGLYNKPTLSVMGGGLGMGTSPEFVQALDQYLRDSQILIITGKNDTIYAQLQQITFNNTVSIYGYVDNIEVHMAAADLLVTKPGGVTASEALALGLPMAFTSPIPGQEWRNSTFLAEQLVAVQFDVSTLAYKVADLLSDHLRLSCMSKLAKALSTPNSTRDVVALLESITRREPI